MSRAVFGRIAAAFCLTLMLAAMPQPSSAAPMQTGFLNATIRQGEKSLPYVVYVPRDYTPEKKWPVVLFLHGAGERGDGGLAQSDVGIGRAIRFNPERFPALVVMPQCPKDKAWGAGIRGFVGDHPDVAELAMGALDEVLKSYSTDPARVYLTGLSMGGYGTWYLGSKYPERFAALLPICGGGKPAEMATALKNLPIWVFHGDADQAVPVARSREMVEAIKAAGSSRIKYTEYPGVGHNSWDAAYGNAEAIAWLLAQKRGQ